MTYRQKMKRVVLPQAFRVIIPPTGNEFIAMMKDTALVSFIGVSADQAEIFRRAQLAGAEAFNPVEAYLLAAGIYWILTIIFTFFQTPSGAPDRQGLRPRRPEEHQGRQHEWSGWRGRRSSVGDRRAVGRPRTPGTGALI